MPLTVYPIKHQYFTSCHSKPTSIRQQWHPEVPSVVYVCYLRILVSNLDGCGWKHIKHLKVFLVSVSLTVHSLVLQQEKQHRLTDSYCLSSVDLSPLKTQQLHVRPLASSSTAQLKHTHTHTHTHTHREGAYYATLRFSRKIGRASCRERV